MGNRYAIASKRAGNTFKFLKKYEKTADTICHRRLNRKRMRRIRFLPDLGGIFLYSAARYFQKLG